MKKIDVSLIELEQSYYDRRPKATLDQSDTELNIDFRYFIKSTGSTSCNIRSSHLDDLELRADFAIIYSYRIPEIILMARNPAVKFIYVQHGYYPDMITRDLKSIIKKTDRILLYLKLIIAAFISGVPFRVLNDLIRLWTIPGHQTKYLPQPTLCVVIDPSWVEFHQTKLNWRDTSYVVKPFYEPKKIEKTERYDYQYICQSLVEDSRIDRNHLIETINNFIAANSIKSLALIAHPRTDRTIYGGLNAEITFITDCCYDLPTFGHYSSLLLYLAENGVKIKLSESKYLKIPADFKHKLTRASIVSDPKIYSNQVADSYLNQNLLEMFKSSNFS